MTTKRKSYFGGKGAVWRTIVNEMPPHLVYIEGCLGGGAVMRNKLPAMCSIGIDLDERPLAAAAGWDIPGLELLQVDCRDWLSEKFLGLFAADTIRVDGHWFPVCDVLVYLDPPYPMETRTSGGYLFDCKDDSPGWHARLLRMAKSLPCMVMISSRPNEQYAEELADWRCVEFQGMTRTGLADEVLYCNFAAPEVLHDPRWRGENKRRREVFRRRMHTLEQRFLRASQREQAAMLAKLVEIASSTGVDFSDVVSLSRTVGPVAYAAQGLESLPWPKCHECGTGLVEFEVGLICPNGHGKIRKGQSREQQ